MRPASCSSHGRLTAMRSEEDVRRRPGATDYVMWAVVALTMVVVLRAVFSVDTAIAWVMGWAYVALGALLLWRRWRSLSR